MRQALLLLFVLIWAGGPAPAVDITAPVYGVLTESDLTLAASEQGFPNAKAYLEANQPSLYRNLHVGMITIAVDASVAQQALLSYALAASNQAQLVPVITQPSSSTYAISGWRTRRIATFVSDSQGTSSQVLYEAATREQHLTITGDGANLSIYVIDGTSVRVVNLTNGFVFPSAPNAAAFRWSTPRLRTKGSINGSYLAGAGANLIALTDASMTELSSYPGAWVQFRERSTGEYRYVQQRQLTHANSLLYDPVALDGDLITGGSYVMGSDPVSAGYQLFGQQNNVTFALSNARLASGLPPGIIAKAESAEMPLPVSEAPILDTTHQRGVMAAVDSDGNPTGQNIQFYNGPQADQSTVTVVDDVYRVAGVATSETPTDNAAAMAGGDRITTPATGSGTSGKSLLQAIQTANTWDYGQTVTGSNSSATIDYGIDPNTGQSRTETLGGSDFLQRQDLGLNQQTAIRYDDNGNPVEPQVKPLILDATGTVADARAAGKPDDVYSAADVVNAQISPHMEGSHWQPRSRARHHGALIYPIDIYDEWGVARWGSKTGVSVPDLAGEAVPGDGDNPHSPKPLGVEAHRPFYDFDDDGDLDRFWTDDPFDGGYKRLRVQWAVTDGVRQLSDFPYIPANNVVVSGIKKPKMLDDGSYAVQEDLLFSIGWNHKPFHHRKFKWRKGTYVTYYTASLITPLDPYSSSDHGLYQLALRNLTAMEGPESSNEGATPSDLVPETHTAWVEEWTDTNGDTIKTQDEVRIRMQAACYYPNLVDYIDPNEGRWTWSEVDFTPLDSIDQGQARIPVRVTETVQDATGKVLSTRIIARPWDFSVDGDTSSAKVLFDPSLIPVNDPSEQPSKPVTDRYMWDYPMGKSTAQGGTQVADPNKWQFPWNVAWNGDQHSKTHSTKTFTLNSANMGYFSSIYAGQTPKITHEGLSADRIDGGTMRVQFLLRENHYDEPTERTLEQWRDGLARFSEQGWLKGMEWWESGRAPFHVFGWDGRTDMHPNTLGNAGVIMSRGNRVYEVEATSLAEYLFRGKKYVAHTTAEQIALLRRMWNYYFFGKEFPGASERCIPSLCIPQRYSNGDLFSRALNKAEVPIANANQYITSNETDADRAGKLSGALTQELNDPSTATGRDRETIKRRVRMLNEQVFLFSAARGREWELEMARRMPRSTKLVCVEWDDKDAVKAVLGRDGGNVVFPEVQTTYRTGPDGAKTEVTVTSELDILRQLALDWFDGKVASLGYDSGRIGGTADYAPTGTDNTTVESANTAVANAAEGFARRLREGMPAALAHYAYRLRSYPMATARQWQPDAGQAMTSDVTVEFRHPMLVLYHDRASAVYVHYGRNCDPEEVFGHWDDCAAPISAIDVETPEFRRRKRFETWASQEHLEEVYNRLNPSGYADLLAGAIEPPPAPPNPGSEPQPPAMREWPGDRPMAPILELRNWDAYGSNPATYTALTGPPWPGIWNQYSNAWAPWDGKAGYGDLTPGAAWMKWVSTITKYDMAKTGWLRVRMSGLNGSGSILSGPANWLNGSGDQLLPMGNPGRSTSSILYGIMPDAYPTGNRIGTTTFDSILFYDLNTGALRASRFWPSREALTVQAGEYRVVTTNDQNGTGFIYWMRVVKKSNGRGPPIDTWQPVSWAGGAHPMTIEYYNALQLKVKADWFQGIYDERQALLETVDQKWANYVQALATWNGAMDAYASYQTELALSQSLHAIWELKKADWDRWATDNAALIQAKSRADQFRADRDAWVSLVTSEILPSGVSWSGDPALLRTTLEAIRDIAPRLPIWEAYGWAIDPTNSIVEVLID